MNVPIERRSTPTVPRERQLLVCTVRDRTRICRANSPIQEALECLGWETLMVEENVALMKGPEDMQ